MEMTNYLRVHACIFVLPTDTFLPSEIQFMKKIGGQTNLIPVIGKADTYMQSELATKNLKVMDLISENEIKMFIPGDIDDEKEIDNLPMAVTASESLFKINGQTKRGRLYKWGFVDVNDTSYNDFLYLIKIIISTHLEEIKASF